ncbi:MAG TPA: SPFH domain-containing protein [Steroidobacteraceae bacterium]|nr:SPFH domain-containing protein [Steroidobacteraceae bacterium]
MARQNDFESDDVKAQAGDFVKKYGWKASAAITALLTVNSGWFTVDPTERANVRRLGTVQYEEPLKQGLHFKLPWIDQVDRLQVSQTNEVVPTFTVSTRDNQVVTLDLSYNFDIPDSCVNQLLYHTGRTGNQDIKPQLEKVTVDRAGFVFAPESMATLNSKRAEVQGTLTTTIGNAIKQQFCIHIDSVQMKLTPSPAFLESNAAAVNQINLAAAANNAKITKQAEADQKVITARGQADSDAAKADGEKRAAIAASEGRLTAAENDAKATEVRLKAQGLGEQARLEAEIRAFGNKPELYIHYLEARAKLNWDGRQPQIVAGNGASTNFVLPLPPLGQNEVKEGAKPAM